MAQRTNTDTGKPSTKHQQGTGIPSKISDDAMQQNNEMTERYTDDDAEIKEAVPQRHPNRNVDKDDATGAGGYRQ